jgi:hypothetical protein
LPDVNPTNVMKSAIASRMIATSPMIFHQLYGRSPDSFPFRPLMTI